MTKEVTFKGTLTMRRGYKDEEHHLSGGSFFIRKMRDEDLGIFFNGPFLKTLCKEAGMKCLSPSEFEELEAEITFKIPDKHLAEKKG